MVPTTETVRNLREGPGYPRHRDYSGFHHGGFFCCERLSASMARSLHLSFICIPQSTRALDQGGAEPRQAVSPKALGHGRYRFATASASGFHHGGADGLIRVELSYPHTNFDR